jgi:hypothetical protein
MHILSTIPERIKTAGRVLFNGQVTGTSDIKGVNPTAGTNGVAILAIATMGEATNLVLNVKTADDADGLNAVDITRDVAVYKDDVRQTADAKTLTIADDSGVVTAVFCVPSILIPEGKFLCLEFENSNNLNVLTAVALDDSYYESGN